MKVGDREGEGRKWGRNINGYKERKREQDQTRREEKGSEGNGSGTIRKRIKATRREYKTM